LRDARTPTTGAGRTGPSVPSADGYIAVIDDDKASTIESILESFRVVAVVIVTSEPEILVATPGERADPLSRKLGIILGDELHFGTDED
jgi:hypothetical protein